MPSTCSWCPPCPPSGCEPSAPTMSGQALDLPVRHENPSGDGAGMLHNWMFYATTDEDRAILQEMLGGVGAIVMGRKDLTRMRATAVGATAVPSAIPHASWSPTTSRPRRTRPCTHSSPTASSARLSRPRARRATTRLSVCTARPSYKQTVPLGLVDKICVHVTPVLLGGGTPLFGRLDSPITSNAPKCW
jgi:dihydrofolate reductase